MEDEVLLLNNDFIPLNICDMKRALLLIYLGKVEILHHDHRIITTSVGSFDSPSVLRLRYHVNRPHPRLRLSRRGILARDNFTCQYCGASGKDMTIDHVIPKYRGGKEEWENLVCACHRCNAKKGDKTLQQSGMRLKRKPFRPHIIPYINFTKYVAGAQNQLWSQYLPLDPEMIIEMN